MTTGYCHFHGAPGQFLPLDIGEIDMPLEDMERYTQELGLQLRLLNERVRDADRQIIELENEVMNQRDNVRDWQDYIDEKLTSMQ